MKALAGAEHTPSHVADDLKTAVGVRLPADAQNAEVELTGPFAVPDAIEVTTLASQDLRGLGHESRLPEAADVVQREERQVCVDPLPSAKVLRWSGLPDHVLSPKLRPDVMLVCPRLHFSGDHPGDRRSV